MLVANAPVSGDADLIGPATQWSVKVCFGKGPLPDRFNQMADALSNWGANVSAVHPARRSITLVVYARDTEQALLFAMRAYRLATGLACGPPVVAEVKRLN